MTGLTVHPLDAVEATSRLDELADILVDAVAHGASVNFMADFSHPKARMFWQDQLPGLTNRTKRLFVAEHRNRLLATALLTFAHQPNAPHRAEIGKMLVHSTARRQGIGRRLLALVETAAHQAGRTLLLLDTETGSAGDLLYRSCGWVEIGRIPDHAFRPDGRLAETTAFYKTLGPYSRTGAGADGR
jgi:GNAT superfamily N-acetyltransferase